MVGQYQQDELDFKTTGHPHGELYEQRQIERGLALCMQGGYMDSSRVSMNRRRRDFNPGMWANRRKAFMASPFLYPFWKK